MVEKLSREKINFKITQFGRDGLTVTLEKLVPTARTDYKDWIARFWNVMTLCGYPEAIAKKYLRLLIDEKLMEYLDPEDSINDQLKSIMKSKYNEAHLKIVMPKIESIKYSQYRNIAEYLDSFEKLIKEANYCLETDEKITQREKEKFFRRGLPQWMKIEFLRLGALTVKGKTKVIREIELYREEDRAEERISQRARRYGNHVYWQPERTFPKKEYYKSYNGDANLHGKGEPLKEVNYDRGRIIKEPKKTSRKYRSKVGSKNGA